MIRIKLNNFGFSLAEIAIAMGLLSILSLGIISSMKTMAKGQATSETKMEELEIRRIIATTLSDKAACQNTFVNFNIGQPILQIKNAAGIAMYEVGKTYGNNSITLTGMSTQDTGVMQNGTRVVNLVLSLQKAKKIVTANVKNTNIQLNVKAASAAGVITECFADTQAIIISATAQACTSVGGTWDSSSGNCTLPSCPAGQVLQAISPTMGAVCKNIGCTLGTVYVGLDASGNPICKSITCSIPGTFFTGLDASGNPICSSATYN